MGTVCEELQMRWLNFVLVCLLIGCAPPPAPAPSTYQSEWVGGVVSLVRQKGAVTVIVFDDGNELEVLKGDHIKIYPGEWQRFRLGRKRYIEEIRFGEED